jgi:beta-lactamase class A
MHKSTRFKVIFLSCVLSTLAVKTSQAQLDSLRAEIYSLASSIKGHVGVAVLHLDNNDTLTFNGYDHFPMQSVYKFPLALAVLHNVDKGKLSLDQKIHITKKDLLPDTWSPLRDKYPNGDVDVSLSELLTYTVSHSDNNGCDILFRLFGGPKNVDEYIHGLGIKNIAIVAIEEEMRQSWPVQYKNFCKPLAMSQLFALFFTTDILSKPSKDFLWKTLIETTTGPNRIKGLLPKEIIVGHKTGTGGRSDKDLTSAINDSGIIILPNGQAVALTIFISDTPEDENKSQAVIAKISKAVYDYYMNDASSDSTRYSYMCVNMNSASISSLA